MLGVVVSRADRASEHVGEHLLDLADWETREDDSRTDASGGGTVYRTDGVELREFGDLHLQLAGAAGAFSGVDLLVFASRHSGETGRLLTAHHTGNFGPAEHGGEPNDLARACPNAHARVLDALTEHAPEGYDVGMECTHHGPTDVGAPSMFVEVGSAEPQWEDPGAARAVAKAILELRGVAPDRDPEPGTGGEAGVDTSADAPARRHIVGFGGGHYVPRFERIVRETDWAVGHIAADWGLDAMGDPSANREVLDRAFAESAAEVAVVEGDRPALVAELEGLGYRVVDETWVRAVGGVPLPLVDRLETELASVSEGLRFGELASAADPGVEFEVVALPGELLAEAQGIDQERVRTVVADATLAFETEESGTRVSGRATVRSRDDYESLLDGMLSLLRRKYDSVDRADDEVIARQTAFDPEKARTLGVPDGPAFGRLAEGEPVEVDGRTIPPEQVHTERVHRFPL